MPIPQSDVTVLARTIAQCRHELLAMGSLAALSVDRQAELKAIARLLIDADAMTTARLDLDLRLRKALAQHVHGTTFERLHEDDRADLVTEVAVVLGVVTRVLAGEAEPLPLWERDLLLGIEDGTGERS